MGTRAIGILLILLLALFAAGLWMATGRLQGEVGSQKAAPVVVCYAALDKEFSQPLLDEFQKKSGIRVDMVFDSEATKTVGLTNRLIAEKGRPRCDVFWNNEAVNTLRLQKEGVLQPFHPEAAKALPPAFRDPNGYWTGFASRCRVVIVNTELVQEKDWPKRFSDFATLAERVPALKGKVGIAKPRFGTTATWVAAFRVDDRNHGTKANEETLRALKNDLDVRVLAGNKQCAEAVGRGDLALAFTDTDDALIEKEAGKPVELLYLEDGCGVGDEKGGFYIPNTLSLVKGAPNADNGRKLIEFLLSPETEKYLANSASGQIPANPSLVAGTDFPARVKTPADVGAATVDWAAVAASWDESMTWAEDILER